MNPAAEKLITQIAALILAGLTHGCIVVGPDYVSPATDESVPPKWLSVEPGMTDTNTTMLTQWWREMNDPVLTTLVETALAGNLDLEQARSQVREARAQRGIETAARFPSLTGSGSAAAVKEGSKPSGELYAVGFDAAWELDLFGRVTRRIEASTADAQARVEAQRGVRVSLLAELALNYIEYRAYEKRIGIARGNIGALQQTLDIVRARYESGLAEELQLARAESNLATEQSRVPPLEAGRDRAAHRLAVLTGQRPGTLSVLLAEQHPVPAPSPEVAVGIPADLLRRRPDLRRAERELAAQSARVGVAKADLYPRFSFSGNLQFGTNDAAKLFDDASRTSGIGPAFSWNIFSAGSVRNNIRVQNERQRQALLHYEQTVLLALEETENAMTALASEQERRRTLAEAVASARRAAALAESLYLDGLRDFLHVLDTQRVLFAAEDQFVLSKAAIASDLVRLYKALGGGWTEPEALP
jgi:NodT family efflux transporter outer membrane factor (OMF) lipoprotein